MTASEALRRRMEHSDGLYEQGIPVDEIVSVVEAAEKVNDHNPPLRMLDDTFGLHRALTALREALEEK